MISYTLLTYYYMIFSLMKLVPSFNQVCSLRQMVDAQVHRLVIYRTLSAEKSLFFSLSTSFSIAIIVPLTCYPYGMVFIYIFRRRLLRLQCDTNR